MTWSGQDRQKKHKYNKHKVILRGLMMHPCPKTKRKKENYFKALCNEYRIRTYGIFSPYKFSIFFLHTIIGQLWRMLDIISFVCVCGMGGPRRSCRLFFLYCIFAQQWEEPSGKELPGRWNCSDLIWIINHDFIEIGKWRKDLWWIQLLGAHASLCYNFNPSFVRLLSGKSFFILSCSKQVLGHLFSSTKLLELL